MKILFFTKSKPYTLKTLRVLIEQGHNVTIVCKSHQLFQGSEMEKWCISNNVEVLENDELYLGRNIEKLRTYDLGISNTYGRLIKKEVIDALRGRIFNIHPAPLPAYKGMFVYNWALYNNESEWGVTAHYVNERFDDGNIIEISKFSIDAMKISVKELEWTSQRIGYELTMEIVKAFENNKQPDGKPQIGYGRYYSRDDFEKLKMIDNNTKEDIDRKIHACWCPPYEGAYILKDGKKYFLISPEIMLANF